MWVLVLVVLASTLLTIMGASAVMSRWHSGDVSMAAYTSTRTHNYIQQQHDTPMIPFGIISALRRCLMYDNDIIHNTK